jgi:uncharacterized protein YndB with AHSA1/START domain
MAEVRIEDERHIEAPPSEVWRAIEDPAAHAAWHPFVIAISGEHRTGGRRTCAVLVGKKTGEVRERCVEAEAERTITWLVEHDTTGFTRMASNPRTGFTLAPHEGGTLVTARSAFEPRNLAVRAVMPLIRRRFHATQRAILAGLAESMSHTAGSGSLTG